MLVYSLKSPAIAMNEIHSRIIRNKLDTFTESIANNNYQFMTVTIIGFSMRYLELSPNIGDGRTTLLVKSSFMIFTSLTANIVA